MNRLINFETAKLAKSAGFNWEVYNFYYKAKKGKIWHPNISTKEKDYSNDTSIIPTADRISRPTQSLLQKWIRDKHKISIKIDDFITEGKLAFDYELKVLGEIETITESEPYNYYEEALEAGLYRALKLIEHEKFKHLEI